MAGAPVGGQPAGSIRDTAAAYRDFARFARGESPCFEAWALAVADDGEVLAWLAGLPPVKRQPNLVFAAARWHGVHAPGPYAGLRAALLDDDGTLRGTVLDRATQTNEAGRLATLVPVLGLVAGSAGEPLSLLEVGASAGLCLYPDRYDYAWTAGTLSGSGGPLLRCTTTGPVPVPRRHPVIARRAGIDLDPRDVADEAQMAWLETLVWPEQEDRRRRLRAAVGIARADPPVLTRGDLLEELPAAVAAAGRHGVPVVLHSAVVTYLDDADRRRFATMMADLTGSGGCRWVSNEGPEVLPDITDRLPRAARARAADPGFLLALDGRPVALAHGHGSSLAWL